MRLSLILLSIIFISCSETSHNSAEWQIKTYSSAAPSYIGDFATVIGGNGEILREGTNGWICQQGNPRPYPKDGWKTAHEAMPACHDEEGMKWMMAYAEGKAPNSVSYTHLTLPTT